MLVLQVLREAGGEATFEYLEQRLPSFGGSLWLHHKHPNCVLWKIEHNHAVAIAELVAGELVGVEPSTRSEYTSDKMASYIENGTPIPMPVASMPGVYQEPHWLPSKLILENKEV